MLESLSYNSNVGAELLVDSFVEMVLNPKEPISKLKFDILTAFVAGTTTREREWLMLDVREKAVNDGRLEVDEITGDLLAPKEDDQ